MGYERKITVDDKAITEGAGLTLKRSLIPCGLGTFFTTLGPIHQLGAIADS